MSSFPSYELPDDFTSDAVATEAIDYRSYPAGTTIIEQGDDTTDVYTLIEGRAIAIQDGKKVGDIQQGEMFGAIAAFTGSKRRASVVATKDCVLRAIRQDTFVSMVKTQPEIAKSIK
ncbi:MAG: cyclic nucleotide-binding domain-containing protein [Pseudomonadales bacterium]